MGGSVFYIFVCFWLVHVIQVGWLAAWLIPSWTVFCYRMVVGFSFCGIPILL